MGKRGPKPTPTRALTARGSWLAKLRAGEIAPPLAPPEPVCALTEYEQSIWDRNLREMLPLGMLTRMDAAALTALATAEAEYFLLNTACNAIKDFGDDGAIALLRARASAYDRLFRGLSHFGCTPSERSKVKSQTPGVGDKGRFFNKKKDAPC